MRGNVHTKVILAAVTGVILSSSVVGETLSVQPFSAVYGVEHSGMRAGETRVNLSRDERDEAYVYESVSKAKGMAALFKRGEIRETSRFRVEDRSILPLQYRFDDGTRKGKRNSALDFHWEGRSVTSTYQGETTDLELSSGLLDRLSVQIAIRERFLAGDAPEAYTLVDRSAVKTYAYEHLATENIDTALGAVQTEKYRRQRDGSSRANYIWFAPGLDYLPVRLEQHKDGKRKIVITLESVQGIDLPGT